MASSASDIQAVLITLMTPIGPLCNCWMMPEETLHRQEKKAREQPEKEILFCRPKKKKKVLLKGQILSSLWMITPSRSASRECLRLWITLGFRISANSLLFSVHFFYYSFLGKLNLISILFLVELGCKVFLSNYIKRLNS